MAIGSHASVRDSNGVTGQIGAVLFQKFRQVPAANLFLTLDQKNHIHRQGPFRQRLADSENVREDLPLVVRGAAAVDSAVANLRIKGRRCPELERFRWLDIVMPINQDGFLGSIPLRFSNDDRISRSRFLAGIQTDLLELRNKPICTTLHVYGMNGLGGNTGNSDKFEQVGNSGIIHGKAICCGLISLSAQDVGFFPCACMRHF